MLPPQQRERKGARDHTGYHRPNIPSPSFHDHYGHYGTVRTGGSGMGVRALTGQLRYVLYSLCNKKDALPQLKTGRKWASTVTKASLKIK